jgi:hypothetical protein
MEELTVRKLRIVLVVIVGLLAVGSAFLARLDSSAAQGTKLPKQIVIQAQAMGTGTQMGRNYNITARVKELSTPEDQAILLEAFKAKGNEGLVNALEKMPAKGRIAITGTLGGDLAYVRRFDRPDGSLMIRMITNRPLRFGEVWADTRSRDYELTALEIIASKDRKKKSGTLYPAIQLKVDKQGHIEIESFQFPWKLVNIQQR